MKWLANKWVKYAFAGIGAVYLVLFVGYLIYAGVNKARPTGPSELEAHPERQMEIVGKQHLSEMQDQLKLTDEQNQKIAEALSKIPEGQDPREFFRSMRDEAAKILTPEQLAIAAQQMRGRFGGPGGPGGPGGGMSLLTPERIESLKQKMTPEQQAKFDKKLQEWEQRRQEWRQGGGPGGGRRGGRPGNPEDPGRPGRGPGGPGGPPPN